MVLPALAAGAARVGAGAAKIGSTATKAVASGAQKAGQAGSKVAANTERKIQSQLMQSRRGGQLQNMTPSSDAQSDSPAKRKSTLMNNQFSAMNRGIGMGGPLGNKPMNPMNPPVNPAAPAKKPGADEEQEEEENADGGEENPDTESSRKGGLMNSMAQKLMQRNPQMAAAQKAMGAIGGMAGQDDEQTKQMISRGATYVANSVSSALDLGTGGVSLIVTFFIDLFTLGYLNAQMFLGKKIPMIGELKWAPIPLLDSLDKGNYFLKGLVITADILLVLALLTIVALNLVIVLLWISPALAPLFLVKFIYENIMGLTSPL